MAEIIRIMEISCLNGFLSNGFIVVFCGMITGIGGGIFRNVLIDTTPYIFKKHIYAMAVIMGGITYFILRKYAQSIQLASLVSVLLVFVIRMLATKYKWSLPKIYIGDNIKNNFCPELDTNKNFVERKRENK